MKPLHAMDDVRVEYLKQHGEGSLAYSSMQKGMSYFLRCGKGYIPYTIVQGISRTPVVLADPVCGERDKEDLLEAFVDIYPNAIFMHISRETAKILADMGFLVNEMGHETLLDVQQFTVNGSKKEFLRSQRNRAMKDGVEVRELRASQVNTEELLKISLDWMRGKTANLHELSLIARPAEFEDEMDVRKFYALKNGKIIGYVFFDPMYRDGKIIGHIANILRSNAETSYSVNDHIILEALKKFKHEGLKVMSLGLSPFCDVTDDRQFPSSQLRTRLFRRIFEKGNHIYSFKELAFHKRKYRPGLENTREVKVYCAARSPLPILCMYSLFYRMGLRPLTQTARHASRCVCAKVRRLGAGVKTCVQMTFLNCLRKATSRPTSLMESVEA